MPSIAEIDRSKSAMAERAAPAKPPPYKPHRGVPPPPNIQPVASARTISPVPPAGAARPPANILPGGAPAGHAARNAPTDGAAHGDAPIAPGVDPGQYFGIAPLPDPEDGETKIDFRQAWISLFRDGRKYNRVYRKPAKKEIFRDAINQYNADLFLLDEVKMPADLPNLKKVQRHLNQYRTNTRLAKKWDVDAIAAAVHDVSKFVSKRVKLKVSNITPVFPQHGSEGR